MSCLAGWLGPAYHAGMLRVCLAIYLAVFACFLPALHTCVPVTGHPPSHSSGPTSVAPIDSHSHSGPAHGDFCIACRLSEDSGGLVAPPPSLVTVLRPVFRHVDAKQPALIALFAPEETLPRAPPA